MTSVIASEAEPMDLVRRFSRVAVLALCLLLLAGCAGGGDGGGGDGGGGDGGGGERAGSSTAPTDTSPDTPTAPPPRLVPVVRLDQPLAMAAPPGEDTVYVGEKTGEVRALRGGELDRTPVLDLAGEVSSGTEQGLLGIAVPDDRRHLYVDYTDRRGDTRVVEFALQGGRADPASRRELLFVPQPYANHNGGQLAFGPDGMLYIGLGDGGGAGDPEGNGQRLDTLLGKVLRIDPRPSDGQPYTVPPDNPFVGRSRVRPEIWAYGLRNPWRFSFDRASGDLWIADVGQNRWEEVNLAPGSTGGENYGWDRREGTHSFSGERPPGAVDPVLEYAREGGACAVTGGYVYRGRAVAALQGAYVYGDYCRGELLAARPQGGGWQASPLGLEVPSLSSFGEDQEGELYALSLDGQVFRLEAG